MLPRSPAFSPMAKNLSGNCTKPASVQEPNQGIRISSKLLGVALHYQTCPAQHLHLLDESSAQLN
jgi:hypothetical protein